MAYAFVYIITNAHNTTLYVGVTNNLYSRLWEHRTKQAPNSFSARYNLTKLVYYESFESIVDAINREKYVKGKTRKFKEGLINKSNPDWIDLSNTL
ncbi:MAG TPA: GIY-YIG nuclease family protein [Sphingobacteriaceae bacterium]